MPFFIPMYKNRKWKEKVYKIFIFNMGVEKPPTSVLLISTILYYSDDFFIF